MTGSRIALVALAVVFACAELAHPTRYTSPKRTVAGGLVLRAQATTGSTGTLDPELLDDLPRIHPDALGTLEIERETHDSTTALRGWIADPDAREAGAAVFPIVNGMRIATMRAAYGLRQPAVAARYGRAFARTGYLIELPAVPPTASLAVGLIAADRRGYFLLDRGTPRP